MKSNAKNLEAFSDIPLNISVELGQTLLPVRDILELKRGSILELSKLLGESMEIFINDLLTARGEVVVVNEKFGIRVTDVIDPIEVIRYNL
ncbi:MAG: flagellar motor switch protein FliN [Nitrospinota bacterium]